MALYLSDTDKILFLIVISMAGVTVILGAIRIWMHIHYGPYQSTSLGDVEMARELPPPTPTTTASHTGSSCDVNAGLEQAVRLATQTSVAASGLDIRPMGRHQSYPGRTPIVLRRVNVVLAAMGAFDDDFYVSCETLAPPPPAAAAENAPRGLLVPGPSGSEFF